MTRPAPGPNGLRRPLWFKRPVRPSEEMYYINGKPSENGMSKEDKEKEASIKVCIIYLIVHPTTQTRMGFASNRNLDRAEFLLVSTEFVESRLP